METTEEENIHNAVNKALTEFSEKLKKNTYWVNGHSDLCEVIDKIMGNFNHRHSEGTVNSTVKEDTNIKKDKGCGEFIKSLDTWHSDKVRGHKVYFADAVLEGLNDLFPKYEEKK